MKKLFVSILALAAFAACQSDFDDVTTNTPGVGDNVVPEGMVRIYAEVGIGEEGTKATYDDNLNAKWEEGDQIALLQESANYGETFDRVNPLNIKSGANTSYASFNGDIIVPTESPRVYHIAYPADAVSFATTSSMALSGGVNYNEEDYGTFLGWVFSATGTYTYTYKSDLSITVPTTQYGKWEPYMYASTSEAVSSNGIGAKKLNVLTGTIAVRAFEADKETPKQLKSITIEATAPIAGAFIGSAESTGSTGSITGAKSDWEERLDSEKKKAQAQALANLESKAKATVPTSVTQTKAMSLSFAGSDKKVTAENLETIAKDADGCYTYHLNVAPFEGADLKITVVSADDSRYVKTIPAQSLAAEHRKGYVFVWENAAFGYEYIDTWYDNCTNTSFAGNTIYISNVKVTGSVDAANVQSIGARIYKEDDTLYKEITESGTLSFSHNEANVPSGKYTVEVFANVNVNGEVVTKSDSKNVTVTAVAALTDDSYIRSSYSYNGGKKTDNTLGGGDLRVKASLNDAYITNNLVQSYTFYYTHNGTTTTVNPTLGKEWGTSFDHNNWGQYDCYVNISLKNGYSVISPECKTHITGIPYVMNTSSNGDFWTEEGTVAWNTDGGVRLGYYQWGGAAYIQSKPFYIPENVTVKVTANGVVSGTGSLWKESNTATITVGSSTVVSNTKNGKGDQAWSCSSASASMSSSSNTIKCNSSYNLEQAKVVVKALKIEF